jgi:diadenosine tetraphosphatase ApaH/serine/threonine PP2A family protein phosphatase
MFFEGNNSVCQGKGCPRHSWAKQLLLKVTRWNPVSTLNLLESAIWPKPLTSTALRLQPEEHRAFSPCFTQIVLTLGSMRVLVISDIHANLTALEAVLEDVGDFDATWCLGDIVGYGPDPNECVARVRLLPNLTCLLGNHDAAVIGDIDIVSFNLEARVSVRWTQSVISKSSLDFLRGLPDKIEVAGQTLAHGSPRHPTWEYLIDKTTIQQNFAHFNTPYCFVGHTHIPILYQLDGDRHQSNHIIPNFFVPIQLAPRAIINPGSVGQPRDRDPRAAYCLFNTETHVLEYRRSDYDVASVQLRMLGLKLPPRHIHRLEVGR